jgi:hypothetical protein
MLWSEYPVVLFRDASGRFERADGGRDSRVLHAWQPSDAQRAEIRAGLAVGPTGARSKSLRAVPGGGWESVGDARPRSASVIGYHERWRIAGTPEHPSFSREDVLAGGRAETVQGSTLYATETASASGDEMSGRFDRDAVRVGRFWMWRSGAIAEPGSSPVSPPPPSLFGAPGSEARERLERLLAEAAPDAERRSEIRHVIRELVREHLDGERSGPRRQADGDSRDRVEDMTRRIEGLLLDEGRSLDEVSAMLADGSQRW